jgi:hypothetical protein
MQTQVGAFVVVGVTVVGIRVVIGDAVVNATVVGAFVLGGATVVVVVPAPDAHCGLIVDCAIPFTTN